MSEISVSSGGHGGSAPNQVGTLAEELAQFNGSPAEEVVGKRGLDCGQSAG